MAQTTSPAPGSTADPPGRAGARRQFPAMSSVRTEKFVVNVRRFVRVALLAVVVTTLTFFALTGQDISRSDREAISRASLRFCADPGLCGANMMVRVTRPETTSTSFARTWASDWNRWAAAHRVPQQIDTVGCNYLWTERYYLCAVRLSRYGARASSAGSCGLIVVNPGAQPNPSDQIENGLETSCRILSTYPQQIVS
jgi:hypothetical protein